MSVSPYVLDTSVLLKWFRQGEVLAEQALALRSAYLLGKITVSLPSLVAYEFTNVLRYKEALTVLVVQEAVQSLFNMRMVWISPSSAGIRRTVELARAYDTTVYDATFVALAEMMGATFVTADESLARRLQVLSFVVFLGNIETSALIR